MALDAPSKPHVFSSIYRRFHINKELSFVFVVSMVIVVSVLNLYPNDVQLSREIQVDHPMRPEISPKLVDRLKNLLDRLKSQTIDPNTGKSDIISTGDSSFTETGQRIRDNSNYEKVNDGSSDSSLDANSNAKKHFKNESLSSKVDEELEQTQAHEKEEKGNRKKWKGRGRKKVNKKYAKILENEEDFDELQGAGYFRDTFMKLSDNWVSLIRIKCAH